MKPVLYISIPTHRSIIDGGCAMSLAWLTHQLGRLGIDIDIGNIDSADIAYSRDLAAHRFLSNKNATHLLTIDSDMVFTAALVGRLLNADKEFIGCIYPKRLLNCRTALAEIAKAGRDTKNENDAIASIAGFVPSDLPVFKSSDDVVYEVARVGMGLTLIARSVFEKMSAAGNIPTDAFVGQEIPGFFQPFVRDGRRYFEDDAFCTRWRDIGGKVNAITSLDIAHVARVEVRATP